jgi:pimeloyl-ACP methyl ester carboxylesterase
VRFPVGYRAFHPDPSIGFELNRWLGALPEDELWAAAPRITTLADWKTVMLELAERAERDAATAHPGSPSALARTRAAAFYYRAVEFFLDPADSDKDRVYRRFVQLFDRTVTAVPHRRDRVPFDGGFLPAIVIDAREAARAGAPARGTLLLHGGFDSLQEELFDWALFFAEGGWDVVLFEGPGQGAALRDHGLVMKPDWERPVAAVLDHFGIGRAAILGISLGGYLAPRAAAFEPRIDGVIVCDILDDFFDCFTARAGESMTRALVAMLQAGARADVNVMMERMMNESPATRWAMHHGMHVSGAADPYEFMQWLRSMSTAAFSERITQDVLLLAGTEDHIVPFHQLWRQARSLTNARSLTLRVFTKAEHAQNHCQVGNVGLALGVVRDWLAAREQASCSPTCGAASERADSAASKGDPGSATSSHAAVA